jgi:hypothetical protein
MADYRELLRRAISALPENNGAARRAVYEKARTALVGQLRAINPPLPARDITQHRLQLEDCIRQVEQEASEAVISLGRENQGSSRPSFTTLNPRTAATPQPIRPAPEPQPAPEPEPEPEPDQVPEPVIVEPAFASAEPEPEPEPEYVPPPEPKPAPTSIEDIISQAAATSGTEPTSPASEPEPEPAPVEPAPTASPLSFFRRREPAAATLAAPVFVPRTEPDLQTAALAQQPVAEPVIIFPPLPDEPPLATIRDVDAEPTGTREAEGAIERAIETLDREARGETTATSAAIVEDVDFPVEESTTVKDTAFAAANAETRSGAGLTIFLVVFALLLVGAGGAGFWAWREGYVDLDQMFGSQPQVTEQAKATDPAVPTMDAPAPDTVGAEDGNAGPGNTATTQAVEPTTALEGLETEDRLEPTPEPVTPSGGETVLPSLETGEVKTEERLSGADTTIAATDDPAASVDPVNLAGNQSLLLEASSNGQSGAVPFSGTVEWSEGTDEIGAPTLVGRASIPARNLGVSITIRNNNDPVLPASHLMEISFDVPESFVGGTVANLAGVLLKDEELVPGTALAGAAARIVGNSFLFALSASPDDVTANVDLLDTRRWLDLAIVYGTGRNAILTLEKDEEAQALFDRVLAAWEE